MGGNTVLIFTSDHGEMLGEHGQWSKRLMLEWSSRIPLIMAGHDRIPAGKRVDAPVSLVDLFPTLLEIAGAQVETPLDGRSLLPLVDGRDDGRERECVAEYLGEGTIEPVRMVRSGKMKYISVNGYPPQLFDLARDPRRPRMWRAIANTPPQTRVCANAPRWSGTAARSRRTSSPRRSNGSWCNRWARRSGISNPPSRDHTAADSPPAAGLNAPQAESTLPSFCI